eukprot:TRINITY_DN896_c0_g1_i12.p1 TRINITY_DN896_c0_g1~~TRINITY_DN896_c0_g1_i12.p1  ORF type:complete len:414 (-),score=70.33 TRINITY_DN896_c0_g1_i12:359-1540(-)
MASSTIGVQEEILKTRMCNFHAAGRCSKGRACTFAHHKSELRPKLNLFKSRPCAAYVRKGYCNEGDACRFAHGANDLRVPLPEAEKPPIPSSSDDESLSEPFGVDSNAKARATKSSQQHQPPVPAVNPSQMLLSTLSMQVQMQMQQACLAGTRVVAIMMPPQPVFAGNLQHGTSPFTTVAFANASSGAFQGQVVRDSADQSSGASVGTVHDPTTVTEDQAEPQKFEVTSSQMSAAHEPSASPNVVPVLPMAPSALPASPSSDAERTSRIENAGTKAHSTVEGANSMRSYDLHLQPRDSEKRFESCSFASEDDEFFSDFSPRGNDDHFAAPTPASCDDMPILDREDADDFWLREADANLVYEKHTFLHVASPPTTASRRSRSSPCGTSRSALFA